MKFDFLFGDDEQDELPIARKKSVARSGAIPPNRLIGVRDVMDLVNISRPTIYRLIQKGEFPRPVAIGASRRWPESEINKWLTDRMDAR